MNPFWSLFGFEDHAHIEREKDAHNGFHEYSIQYDLFKRSGGA